jgi:hypothetical protein
LLVSPDELSIEGNGWLENDAGIHAFI